jgi:pimeloyl-ACP methyl ester carboxylesterase
MNDRTVSKTTNTKEGVVEFSLYGVGIPILFVHGGHTSSRFTLPHKGLDTDKFQLITPSRPGYGGTPLKNKKTPRDAGSLFVSLLDSLNIQKAIIYGISAGGLTALEIAGNFPERVEKLILVSAASMPWLDKNNKIYRLSKIFFSPLIELVTWGLIKTIAGISPKSIARVFFKELSSVKNPELGESEITEFIQTVKTFRSKTGFVNDIDQTLGPDVLRKIICPTLILHSKNDNGVSLDHASLAKAEIRNSKLNILDNQWGHMVWIGGDYKFAHDIILRFIDDKN